MCMCHYCVFEMGVRSSVLVFENCFSLDGCLGCFQSFADTKNAAVIFFGFSEMTLIKMCCKRSFCISLSDLSIVSRMCTHSKQRSLSGSGPLTRDVSWQSLCTFPDAPGAWPPGDCGIPSWTQVGYLPWVC